MSDGSEQAVVLAKALDKIRHQTTSNLVNQKRPATLLVALEATLTEQEAALTPVAYFAALLSTTQQLIGGGAEDTDGETLPAALYLLAIVLPCVQASIVKSKSGPLLESLAPLLVSLHDQAATIKSLLSIFQAVYLSLDGSSLGSLQAKQVFNGVLAFLVDARPKVRRKAQEAVQAMLASPPAPSTKHPYAVRVAEYVIESLRDALKEGKKGGKRKMQNQNDGAVSEETSRAIGLCSFIKMVGKDWPASEIAPLCALLLSLPRLGNPFLTGASYDILETLFSKSSDSFEEGKVEETLEAVLAAKPAGSGSVDERILPGWLGTVEHGFVAFARSVRWMLKKMVSPRLTLHITGQILTAALEPCCRLSMASSAIYRHPLPQSVALLTRTLRHSCATACRMRRRSTLPRRLSTTRKIPNTP